MNGFENYMLDQFPLRDGFRTLKAAANAMVFMQRITTDYIPSESTSQSWIFRRTSTLSIVPPGAFRYVYDTYLRNGGTKTYLSVIRIKMSLSHRQTAIRTKDYKALVERLGGTDFRRQSILIFPDSCRRMISIIPIRTGGRKEY